MKVDGRDTSCAARPRDAPIGAAGFPAAPGKTQQSHREARDSVRLFACPGAFHLVRGLQPDGSQLMAPMGVVMVIERDQTQLCRWTKPTLLLPFPFWLDSESSPWSCLRDGPPRPLETTAVCRTCPRWETRRLRPSSLQ
jgi:hypothetical protein